MKSPRKKKKKKRPVKGVRNEIGIIQRLDVLLEGVLLVVVAELPGAVVQMVLHQEQVAVALRDMREHEEQRREERDEPAIEKARLEPVPLGNDVLLVSGQRQVLVTRTEVISRAVPLTSLDIGCHVFFPFLM